MNDLQSRQLATYVDIVQWFSQLKKPLAPEAPHVVDQLKATIAEIQATASTQLSLAQERQRTAARTYLEQMRDKQMMPLARMARKLFRGEPAIKAKFRVPHKRANAETILEAAELMVKTLSEHRELLVEGRVNLGRPDALEKETQRSRKRFTTSKTLVADRGVPTRRLTALFREAYDDVLTLQSFVAASQHDDPKPPKNLWRIRKHMGRPKTRRKRS